MLKETKVYKQEAIRLMADKKKNAALIMFCFYAIAGAVMGILSWNQFLASLGGLIQIVLMGAISYSLIQLWRNILNGKVSDLKETLMLGVNKDLVLHNSAVFFLKNIIITLFSILLIVPGVIKAFQYAMVFYLLHKEPNLKYMEVLKRSKALMDGHKNELFKLCLAFITDWLLCLVTFGIYSFWAFPKYSVAEMMFFDDLYAAAPAK